MKQAIEYEARRQIEVMKGGGTIKQETRHTSDIRVAARRARRARSQTRKTIAISPDPDLLPLVFTAICDKIRASLPELPDARKNRFIKDYGLTPYDADSAASSIGSVLRR